MTFFLFHKYRHKSFLRYSTDAADSRDLLTLVDAFAKHRTARIGIRPIQPEGWRFEIEVPHPPPESYARDERTEFLMQRIGYLHGEPEPEWIKRYLAESSRTELGG